VTLTVKETSQPATQNIIIMHEDNLCSVNSIYWKEK